MKTVCNKSQARLQAIKSKKVEIDFDGGILSSDGGAVLLRETENQIHLIKMFSECFTDLRNPCYIVHKLPSLISQRIMALATGYEDINDHDSLRQDTLFSLLCDRDALDIPAGKSTIQRMEQIGANPRYHKIVCDFSAVDRLLVDFFLNSHSSPPKEMILDLDATDVILHGDQERKFFHGYYGHYCYLPLLITCGDFILRARLRPSDRGAFSGWQDELPSIVNQIRERYPNTRIIVRGDSGFTCNELMEWCEDNGIFFLLGMRRNNRLAEELKEPMEQAKSLCEATGEAARVFKQFLYQTKESWPRPRRIIGKAEYLPQGANPRYIVTNLTDKNNNSAYIYEKIYCERGNMENVIKMQQNDLFGYRLSANKMESNQLRLYLSTIAYSLMMAMRRLGLRGTELEKAQRERYDKSFSKSGGESK